MQMSNSVIKKVLRQAWISLGIIKDTLWVFDVRLGDVEKGMDAEELRDQRQDEFGMLHADLLEAAVRRPLVLWVLLQVVEQLFDAHFQTGRRRYPTRGQHAMQALADFLREVLQGT